MPSQPDARRPNPPGDDPVPRHRCRPVALHHQGAIIAVPRGHTEVLKELLRPLPGRPTQTATGAERPMPPLRTKSDGAPDRLDPAFGECPVPSPGDDLYRRSDTSSR